MNFTLNFEKNIIYYITIIYYNILLNYCFLIYLSATASCILTSFVKQKKRKRLLYDTEFRQNFKGGSDNMVGVIGASSPF